MVRTRTPLPPPIRHWVACLWFWAWAIIGAIAAVGLVSLGSIALGAAMIVGAALSRNQNARRSTSGLLAGAGLVSLFIATTSERDPEPPAGTHQPPPAATSTSTPFPG